MNIDLLKSISIVDIVIVLSLIMGTVYGFYAGIIKKAVSLVGLIVSVLVAYFFKDLLANYLYSAMPFFSFSGKAFGLTSLNFLMYQLIAFFFILSVMLLIYNIVLKIANIAEKLIESTVILSLPSRILGAILGFIETYVFIFIVLIVLNMPIFSGYNLLNKSKIAKPILNSTPLISIMGNKTVKSVNEIYKEINKKESKNKINKEIIKILIKNKVISRKTANKLIKDDKI